MTAYFVSYTMTNDLQVGQVDCGIDFLGEVIC